VKHQGPRHAGLIFLPARTRFPGQVRIAPAPNPYPLSIPLSAPVAVRAIRLQLLIAAAAFAVANTGFAAQPGATAASDFHQSIQPLLSKYCYECHGQGMDKGSVVFDEFESDRDLLERRDLWLAVLKNVRAGLMPPPNEDVPRPEASELAQLEHWIKFGAFATDPANPDPGRVITRRLNRIEYRNTIRDLMGIDYNSEVEFPPDDSGNGFDNNGEVLTLSPLLLEKYLSAADAIVAQAVPKVAKVMREHRITGRDFLRADGGGDAVQLSAAEPAVASHTFTIDETETYQLVIDLEARGSFDYDPGHCKVICRVDGVEQFVEEIVWEPRKALRHEFTFNWPAGTHTVSFEVVPLPPIDRATDGVALADTVANVARIPAVPGRSGAPGPNPRPPPRTRLDVGVVGVQIRGPINPDSWIPPENYARFFPKGPAPEARGARDRYAAEILEAFATRAFRRPVTKDRVRQLVGIAREVYRQPDRTFEEGVGRAMMAVLASPRFVFRVEGVERGEERKPVAQLDEYALASRLSYFLWSSMPDEELLQLAATRDLRRQLPAQVDRMLRDPRAQAFVRNFTGQWLQVRDVEFVPINARVVLGPDAPRTRENRIDFDGPMRRLMRSETEMYFQHILREDRSVLELLDSDYTFLNAQLARHYGLPDVEGDELRLVRLPADSPRGGVLTQGAILAVTSNPTRTSPVKRGLFVLENILGTPTPPAPPDVPDLEESRKEFDGREPKLSEMLALHRSNRLCNSCHSRMDPLGLAFENFNALGGWRDTEAQQPIDPAGQLITGEAFGNVRELKRILAQERQTDFYRCLTEKLLTYALGRGLDYHDVHAVDQIVERLAQADGRISALVMGVIESTPFQKQRTTAGPVASHFPSGAARPGSVSLAKPSPTP